MPRHLPPLWKSARSGWRTLVSAASNIDSPVLPPALSSTKLRCGPALPTANSAFNSTPSSSSACTHQSCTNLRRSRSRWWIKQVSRDRKTGTASAKLFTQIGRRAGTETWWDGANLTRLTCHSTIFDCKKRCPPVPADGMRGILPYPSGAVVRPACHMVSSRTMRVDSAQLRPGTRTHTEPCRSHTIHGGASHLSRGHTATPTLGHLHWRWGRHSRMDGRRLGFSGRRPCNRRVTKPTLATLIQNRSSTAAATTPNQALSAIATPHQGPTAAAARAPAPWPGTLRQWPQTGSGRTEALVSRRRFHPTGVEGWSQKRDPISPRPQPCSRFAPERPAIVHNGLRNKIGPHPGFPRSGAKSE